MTSIHEWIRLSMNYESELFNRFGNETYIKYNSRYLFNFKMPRISFMGIKCAQKVLFIARWNSIVNGKRYFILYSYTDVGFKYFIFFTNVNWFVLILHRHTFQRSIFFEIKHYSIFNVMSWFYFFIQLLFFILMYNLYIEHFVQYA